MAEDSGAARRAGGGPLRGVHVLEVAHYIAGPHCAMILADHGADVIKLEPLEGELGRFAQPLSPGGNSLFFASHNRGKKSVAVDLRNGESAEIRDSLLRWADVVVTNYTAGVPDRLGFGYQRLSELNPRAVLVHITGFGSWSAQRDYAAFDGIIQAMSGLADLTGHPEGPPVTSEVLVADHATAVHAATAALCALQEKNLTGTGSYVEVSMLQVLTSMLGSIVPTFGVLGQKRTRNAGRSTKSATGSFKAADADVYISPSTPAMWISLCELIGHPELAEPEPGHRPGFISDPAGRVRADTAIANWMGQRTAADAVAQMQSHGIACGVVRNIERLFAEESGPTSRIFDYVSMSGDISTIPVPGPSFRFEKDASSERMVPGLGADSVGVLVELGLPAAKIAGWVQSGVIRDGQLGARAAV